MGAWDVAPWDNDSAADWFGNLFDDMPLAARVEQTLNLPLDDAHEEIRAAASVLIMLGRVYIWPINDLDRHLALAIKRLQEIREMEVYAEVPEFVKSIDGEIAILKNRLERKKEPAPQPTGWNDFWQ